MRMPLALAAGLLAATTLPAFATSCADEVSTLEKRLNSAGAAQVTGTAPDGPTAGKSPKALDAAPNVAPSDKSTVATASGVEEARKLVAQAREEDKAGKADACRDTILKAKETAGSLP